jgi:teichoic acid transport system permease protein
VQEHVDYRRQILQLAAADIIKTYRGSALGWSWAVIKPSVTIFVYWFAFSVGLRQSGEVNGYPFFLWLLASCRGSPGEILTQGQSPRALSRDQDQVPRLVVHIALTRWWPSSYTGNPVDVYYLQLPLYMAAMFLFWTGWALFAAPLAVSETSRTSSVRW